MITTTRVCDRAFAAHPFLSGKELYPEQRYLGYELGVGTGYGKGRAGES